MRILALSLSQIVAHLITTISIEQLDHLIQVRLFHLYHHLITVVLIHRQCHQKYCFTLLISGVSLFDLITSRRLHDLIPHSQYLFTAAQHYSRALQRSALSTSIDSMRIGFKPIVVQISYRSPARLHSSHLPTHGHLEHHF